ncbi:MAG: peptide chain release factor N(5)-glutamine methyltransferase [Bacteroidales bacterium]|nr:peptide chain release factor N(5)-glutamine methyltransferase [Bacteroidales bacterium]
MTLAELNSLFRNQLVSMYPSQEVENIFFLTVNFVLKYSKIDIHLNSEKEIPSYKEKILVNILSRLNRSEPVQYILGETEFYGLKIKTDPRALIPRPETELLTDIVIKENSDRNSLSIIDLCTGSGCIAIAVSKYLTGSVLTAIEISNSALELAKENASLYQVHINFIKDDILSPEHHYGKFDIIVSNPPYIRNSEKNIMHRNVTDYEPEKALFVEDSDPLIFYRAISYFGKIYLNKGGLIYAEINEVFGKKVKELFRSAGYKLVKIYKDFNNKDRFIKAKQ